MKKILIIYPHFPPSNLAGVHRPRLFAQNLHLFDWEPVLLTVDEAFYEEKPDWNLVKLVPKELRIEKVKAFKITRPRLIGDIGLRGFFQLYKRALAITRSEKIDFILIPIPSFYCSILGRLLYNKTKIPYGIDYIDPWVHQFPGSDKVLSRHWFSTKLAGVLEKYAVKHASLITGVADGYFQPVLERNKQLQENAVHGSMPYGGEQRDHDMLDEIPLRPYLFNKKAGKFQVVYAGAMMPKSYSVLDSILASIAASADTFSSVEFHFIGTGSSPDDPHGFNIKPLAEKYNLWNSIVFEYPQRIPYLDVLVHLSEADAIFILGSTEPHYTPSKSYQGVLSKKPVMAVLHTQSSAVEVLRRSHAGMVLDFNGETDVDTVKNDFVTFFVSFKKFVEGFDPTGINYSFFEQYSAKAVTGKLAALIEQAIAK